MSMHTTWAAGSHLAARLVVVHVWAVHDHEEGPSRVAVYRTLTDRSSRTHSVLRDDLSTRQRQRGLDAERTVWKVECAVRVGHGPAARGFREASPLSTCRTSPRNARASNTKAGDFHFG
jgi:hypothetical protein